MAQVNSMQAYVKVFSELCSEDSVFSSSVEEAELTINVLWADDALKHFLCSPVVAKDVREKCIKIVFEKLGASHIWTQIFVLMIRKGRMADLQEFKNELRLFADKRCGIIRGVAQTAVKVNNEIKEKVNAFLKDQLKSEIVLEYKINPELLGGLKVSLNGVVLDASIELKLKEAKLKLLKKRA